MNEARLNERGIGRKEASECVKLIEASAEGLTSLHAVAAFWDSIREFMADVMPEDPVVGQFDSDDVSEAGPGGLTALSRFSFI
jgi:hypothetical protein